jgi:hypothetical protein
MRNTFKQIGQQEWHAAFILKRRCGTSKTVVEERLKVPAQTSVGLALSHSPADSPENVPACS